MAEQRDLSVCERPPAGWRCSRPAGHDGPCAASPTGRWTEAPGTPRKLWQAEYGWSAANPDGSLEAGDLYVVDGVVRFMTPAEAREAMGGQDG